MIGNDFYTWVNQEWLNSVRIPSEETDFGVSEELETCIQEKVSEILMKLKHESNPSPAEAMIQTLTQSCLHSAAQPRNIETLHLLLSEIDCIETSQEVMRHVAHMTNRKLKCLFDLEHFVDEHKQIHVELTPEINGLNKRFYFDEKVMNVYTSFLHQLATLAGLDPHIFDSVPSFEKTLQIKLDDAWEFDPVSIKGSQYVRKYPTLAFDTLFETLHIPSWKSQSIYTPAPKFLRFLNSLLKEVPLDFWKVWLKKCVLVACMEYCPPPFDELYFSFFREFLQGQKIKMPQMNLLHKIVFDLCPHEFSPLFWNAAGDDALLKHSKSFGKHLLKAAKHRLSTIDWWRASTRAAACEKVENMMFSFIKPDHWPTFTPPTLKSDSLLENVLTLGQQYVACQLKLVGTKYKYWEEGIYRVNAYYYSNKNQIMIPYGTVLSPFYSTEAPLGWNYGALGSLIGHEMCHGFDLDGKEYGINGKKQNWWTRKDKMEYMKRAKQLDALFSKEKVLGHSVNGKLTLDENIADLGGVGIALEALKQELREKKLSEDECRKAYRHFFVGYAVSWRTKYRDAKLLYSIQTDKHAPAFLRVNLVVNQFQEWYDVFDIPKDSDLYRNPEDRIRIF